MDRARVSELHFITTVDNLKSICEHGILSRNNAAKLPHTSIADEDVQDRRAGKRVPGGNLLHDYANLYFDARNAMMYRRKNERRDIIVLRVNPNVMELPGAVITDGNAASGVTRFFASPSGLAELDEAFVFAQSWNHADEWEKRERKRRRQAEVLVPSGINPVDILCCMIRTKDLRDMCLAESPAMDVEVVKNVFFD